MVQSRQILPENVGMFCAGYCPLSRYILRLYKSRIALTAWFSCKYTYNSDLVTVLRIIPKVRETELQPVYIRGSLISRGRRHPLTHPVSLSHSGSGGG